MNDTRSWSELNQQHRQQKTCDAQKKTSSSNRQIPTGPFTINVRADILSRGGGGGSWDSQKTAGHFHSQTRHSRAHQDPARQDRRVLCVRSRDQRLTALLRGSPGWYSPVDMKSAREFPRSTKTTLKFLIMLRTNSAGLSAIQQS